MRSNLRNAEEMPSDVNAIYEFVVMEPHEFEEMLQAIQALCQGKCVVLNLTMIDPIQAQRSLDFVKGGIYSISGHQHRISARIFLFTPSCVQVSKQSDLVHEVSQAQIHFDYPVDLTPNQTPELTWIA